jgi:hypothetical protein
MSVNINRPFEKRLVKWRGGTESEPVKLLPGAAWNLYVPASFAGTSITVKALVDRDIDDSATDEAPIKDYKTYDGAAVAITPDQVHDLTAMNLFGLSTVKFVSNATETCTGELMLSS